MRIFLIFIWIIFGAVILWFFAENLDQNVTIEIFNNSYENVNLVTVIFLCLFLGTVLGALLLTIQILKSKAQLNLVKRENKKLLNELENLRNLPVQQKPDLEPENGA
jgi:hypothetical protein